MKEMKNYSSLTGFLLLPLSDQEELQAPLFFIIFTIHALTLLVNGVLILLIRIDHHLHLPMYFLLGNLSFVDIGFSITTIPNILGNILMRRWSISYTGCIAQLYSFTSLMGTETFLLSAMAWDRYVAICKPLFYRLIMSPRACFQLACGSWVFGLLNSLLHTILTFRLPFCGHQVHQYFCEVPPLLKLACSDTLLNDIMLYVVGWLLLFGANLLILISYVLIVQAVLKIPSSKGKMKAISTCASHLTVVLLLYVSSAFIYLIPKSKGEEGEDKIVSLFYTVIAPLLNPLIYSFRNQDVKVALRKVLGRNIHFTKSLY